MDVFDGPNWFGIAFSLAFVVGPSLFLLAFAVVVWFLVGSRRVWAAIAAWQGSPIFPRTAEQEYGTRRRIIWSIRGIVLGSALVTVATGLVVGLPLPMFDEIRGWSSAYDEWFTTGLPAIGATIGATLAARLGSMRTDAQAPKRLRDYVPRWLTATSVAFVGVNLAALAIVTATGNPEALTSGIGMSATIAIVSLTVFLLGWRPLLTRSAAGSSRGWADLARATALWMLALLPVVMSLTVARSLVHLVAYADGPVTTPLTVVASVISFGADLVPQTMLIVALFIAPLHVVKHRHPERYAALRVEWRSARQYRRAARTTANSRA